MNTTAVIPTKQKGNEEYNILGFFKIYLHSKFVCHSWKSLIQSCPLLKINLIIFLFLFPAKMPYFHYCCLISEKDFPVFHFDPLVPTYPTVLKSIISVAASVARLSSFPLNSAVLILNLCTKIDLGGWTYCWSGWG